MASCMSVCPVCCEYGHTGRTLVCSGTPVENHCCRVMDRLDKIYVLFAVIDLINFMKCGIQSLFCLVIKLNYQTITK